MNITDFTLQTLDQRSFDCELLKNKVVLIVNVASKCGFTNQYEGLEKLYQKYKDQGFIILGFPCNQFGGQEPGNHEEIAAFCSTTYQVTFPIMEKIEVNGEKAHPLYQFLKESLPGLLGTKAIKWNFTKFLIDKSGIPVERFAPNMTPEELNASIVRLLDPSQEHE